MGKIAAFSIMSIDDQRKGDRFVATEAIQGTFSGTFGAADVVVLDLSLGGAKLSHPQPIRIGTRARLTFKRGDVSAFAQGQIIWSHLSRAGNGMSYVSGIRLDGVDAQYAMALNSLLRAGALRKDVGSLERKQQLLNERELTRKTTQSRPLPTGGGIES
jgi:hypothetical protein